MNRRPAPRPSQSGAVLIFTLIVMLILSIGAVGLVRSMNTSLFGAGNLAFRRDLMNQGESAVAAVLADLANSAVLRNTTATESNLKAANYSATMLPTNNQGVPLALLDDAVFATVGTAAKDIAGMTADVTIRYLVDRLCTATGPSSGAMCVQWTAAPTGGTANATAAVATPTATVYRVSVRVSGARNTQLFLQTTVTKPD